MKNKKIDSYAFADEPSLKSSAPWKLSSSKTDFVSYSIAPEHVKAGGTACRAGWIDPDAHLYSEDEDYVNELDGTKGKAIMIHAPMASTHGGIYIPADSDINTKDWILLEDE